MPELQAKQRAKEEQERARQEKQLDKLRKDMASKAAISSGGAGQQQQQQQEQEQGGDEDDGESADLELSDDSIEGSVGGGFE